MSERIVARRDSVSERVALAVAVVTQSICDKLPKCPDGSLNINKTDLQRLQAIRNMLSAYPDTKNATLTNSKHICETITKTTSIVTRREPKNSETDTMPLGGNDTRPIQRIGKNILKPSKVSLKKKDEMGGLETLMVSDQTNTPKCFVSSTTFAPSAPLGLDCAEGNASPLTTATKPKLSEAFSAPTVIEALDCSQTTQTGLIEQSNISQRPEISPWVIWCQLNDEQSQVKAAFGSLAISIHGGHSEEEKERLHEAWLRGDAPIMICKPKMFSHGCNWQHCNQTVFVGLNDSFEQVYQAIRRFWRFGQTKPVNAHTIAAETEGAVVQNLRRKEDDADRMAASMVAHMSDLSRRIIHGQIRDTRMYDPNKTVQLPSWLN